MHAQLKVETIEEVPATGLPDGGRRPGVRIEQGHDRWTARTRPPEQLNKWHFGPWERDEPCPRAAGMLLKIGTPRSAVAASSSGLKDRPY